MDQDKFAALAPICREPAAFTVAPTPRGEQAAPPGGGPQGHARFYRPSVGPEPGRASTADIHALTCWS